MRMRRTRRTNVHAARQDLVLLMRRSMTYYFVSYKRVVRYSSHKHSSYHCRPIYPPCFLRHCFFTSVIRLTSSSEDTETLRSITYMYRRQLFIGMASLWVMAGEDFVWNSPPRKSTNWKWLGFSGVIVGPSFCQISYRFLDTYLFLFLQMLGLVVFGHVCPLCCSYDT